MDFSHQFSPQGLKEVIRAPVELPTLHERYGHIVRPPRRCRGYCFVSGFVHRFDVVASGACLTHFLPVGPQSLVQLVDALARIGLPRSRSSNVLSTPAQLPMLFYTQFHFPQQAEALKNAAGAIKAYVDYARSASTGVDLLQPSERRALQHCRYIRDQAVAQGVPIEEANDELGPYVPG